MKENGKMDKLVVKGVSGMLTETLMKDSGFKIRLMDTASTYMLMVQNILAIGKKMFNTVAGKKHGRTALHLRVIMLKVRNTDREHISGLTVPLSAEVGLTTKLMALECTYGLTEESLRETGKITICTERENTPGPMVDAMKVTMKMIRNTDKASTHGVMGDNIVVSG